MWIFNLKSVDSLPKKCEFCSLKLWVLKLKSLYSEVEKCGFVKKNSQFFYCLIPKVWFKSNWSTFKLLVKKLQRPLREFCAVSVSIIDSKTPYTLNEFIIKGHSCQTTGEQPTNFSAIWQRVRCWWTCYHICTWSPPTTTLFLWQLVHGWHLCCCPSAVSSVVWQNW